MKTPIVPAPRPSILAGSRAILLLVASIALATQVTSSADVERSPRWYVSLNTGKAELAYGPEYFDFNESSKLGNFLPADYEHCRWGVVMSQSTFGAVDLPFTWLTQGPFEVLPESQQSQLDLFMSSDTSDRLDMERVFFPGLSSNETWTPSNGTSDGKVTFTVANGTNDRALYRYLHFPRTLSSALVPGDSLDSSSKKVILLMHGWNPDSKSSHYNGEFAALYSALNSGLEGGWQLARYDWARDADTGDNTYIGLPHPKSAVHGTRAAEIARQHGWHLGDLLNQQCQNLQQIHIIAHSAGSWAAHELARNLLKNHSNSKLRVQITLLDPFVPEAVPGIGSNLSVSGMERLSDSTTLGVGNASKVFRLENYFADDLALGTQESFDGWYNVSILGGIQSGYATDTSIWSPYDQHDGPIKFFSDTVKYALGTPPDGHAILDHDLSYVGWRRSMFSQEPILEGRSVLLTLNVGDGGEFAVTANTRARKSQGLPAGGVTYQWYKEGTTLSGEINSTLQFAGVTTEDAGNYTVEMSNLGLRLMSPNILLRVNGSGESPLGPPSNLVATAVSSGQIKLTWADNSSNEIGFKLERSPDGSTGWSQIANPATNATTFTDSGLAASATYFYRLRAAGSSGDSTYSNTASAATPQTVTTYQVQVDAVDVSVNQTVAVNTNSWIGLSTDFRSYTTSFTRNVSDGSVLSVTTPATLVGGRIFQYWLLDVGTRIYGTWATVLVEGGHSLIAIYDTSPPVARTLSNLTVEGPTSVDERSTGQYRVLAGFTDGTSGYVTAVWAEDSPYASISDGGMLEATSVGSDKSVTVVAVYSEGGVTLNDTKIVTIRNADTSPLVITTGSSLAAATRGRLYSASLRGAGGNSPYEWSVASGSLPSGLSLSSTGTISGSPAALGNFSFRARVTDEAGTSLTKQFYLQVLQYAYFDMGSSITITDFDKEFAGVAVIPSSINGKPVTSIGSSAFYQCWDVTSVVIPSSVTSIGSNAFYSSGLTSVTIPSSVSSIGSGAFAYCPNLTEIVTDASSVHFSSLDGVLFNKSKSSLIQCPVKKAGDYLIPAGVTSIGDYAFFRCWNLTSVAIPSSVSSIGASAFKECSRLTDVTIPGSVANIGSYAFRSCLGLTNINVPGSVTSIGVGSFAGCSKLTAIPVDASSVHFSSLDGVLFNKTKTSLIQCPAGKTGGYLIPASVTSIESSAFYSCSRLTAVNIPSSVTSIGRESFYFCIGLTNVTIPGRVTSIGWGAFYECSRLIQVIISGSVTSIESSAFHKCDRLEGAFFLGDSPTIGSLAFAETASVFRIFYSVNSTGFTSPTWQGYPATELPNTRELLAIGPAGVILDSGDVGVDFGDVVAGETLVRTVTVANIGTANLSGLSINTTGANASDFTLGSLGANNLLPGEGAGFTVSFAPTAIGARSATIQVESSDTEGGPFDIQVIGSGFPDDVFDLKVWAGSITVSEYIGAGGVVNIPATINGFAVTSIGVHAFQGNRGLTSVTIPSSVASIGDGAFNFCENLTSVSIPDGVTTIGATAFGNCRALTSLSIPSSVTSIGKGAFSQCNALMSIEVALSNPNYSSLDGVLFNKARTQLIQFPGGFAGDYSIPMGVTRIGDRAFSFCRSLAYLTIPDSVTVIEASAFWAGSMTSVIVGSGVTKIDNYTFYGCSQLKSVTLPHNLTNIGSNAFAGCMSLTNLTIPPGVTDIGSSAFLSCEKLVGVSLPSGLKSIGGNAFSGCRGLSDLYIPSSLTSIGNLAFIGCTGLGSAVFSGNAPTVVGDIFGPMSPGFMILFDSDATGFTMPTWQGYPAAPLSNTQEILVTGPEGTSLSDNGDGVGFGAVYPGNRSVKTFSILNAGQSTLSGLSVVIDGVDALDFTVGALGATSLEMGKATTFAVTFTPPGLGDRTATVRIASNDADENPFDIDLTGSGSLSAAFDYQIFGDTIDIIGYSGPGGEVIIPATIDGLPVTSVGLFGFGPGAFAGNSGLTSVTIPASVTNIGMDQFAGCTNLVAIIVDPANTEFSSLDGVLFNKDQTTLIQYPAGKTGYFEIPNSVTSIGDEAFRYCVGLAGVTLSENVSSIGSGPFAGCTTLVAITVDPTNAEFSSLDGVLFNKDQTTLIQYPAGKTGSYDIPNSVTSVGAEAFVWCIELTEVGISSSIVSIEFGAFALCTGLKNVTIPASVESIGDSAFYHCDALVSAFFLGKAPDIGWDAFYAVSPGFTVLFLIESTGFAAPQWQGYPAEALSATQEIRITGPAGSSLTSDEDGIDFGNVYPGADRAKTFTILNTGNLDISSLAITKSGTNAADFAVGSLGATTLAPGASTIFSVSFSPSELGNRDAVIHIASNDADENPFDISVSGNGLDPDLNVAAGIDLSGAAVASGGQAGWLWQTAITHDGVDAAQSDDIFDGQTSSFSLTASGPGSISFWWKVSSELDWDYLRFYIDGVEQSGSISGEVDWEQRAFILAEGTHTLQWAYTKDEVGSSGFDCGWVDQVVLPGSGTPLEVWRQGFFGTTADRGNAANVSDPDFDGLNNLLEFAFGLDPLQNSVHLAPKWQHNGNTLTCSFSQPPGVSGITYGAEWSPTMAPDSWLPIDDTGTAPHHIFTVSIDSHPMKFVRFKITSTFDQVVPTALESWRKKHFGTISNTGDAADLADKDQDGIPNLLEFAYGLHPHQNSAHLAPKWQVSGSNLTCTFTQPLGVTGISYGAQWSSSMAPGSWQPISDLGTALQHTFSIPINSGPTKFVRLTVEGP